MTLNVLSGFNGRETLISPRSAAKYLGISPGLFFMEMRVGTLQWQTRIDGDSPTSKPTYGFEVKYLEEIKPLLDTKRKGSKRLFTDEVKERIKKINWLGTDKDNSIDMIIKKRDFHPGRKGEKNSQAKLSSSQIFSIRSLWPKKTQQEIADQFGIHRGYVSLILNRKRWK